jgi:two-component sensor histidine kinase
MDESAQRLRSHVQVIVSLINLHAQYIDSVDVRDFVNKLRMRIELIATTLPLALVPSPERKVVFETFSSVAAVVAEIYDPQDLHACELTVDDVDLPPAALAPICQLFAEFLSNIYAAAKPDASERVAARLFAVPQGRIALSVSAKGMAPRPQPEPLDFLTSRIIQELARSLDGEATFDRGAIRDARLILPMTAGGGGTK